MTRLYQTVCWADLCKLLKSHQIRVLANDIGWKDAGKVGTKEECLAYIKEVWTDMRPLSLRKKMEEQSQGPV